MLSLLFHHAVNLILHMLLLLSLKEQWMLFHMCCHRTFSKHWMDFHMLSLLFQFAVDVVFHMLSICPLSKISGFCFLYVVSTHLISSGWFSICYHFCARSSLSDFPHAITALLQRKMVLVFHVFSKHL